MAKKVMEELIISSNGQSYKTLNSNTKTIFANKVHNKNEEHSAEQIKDKISIFHHRQV